MNVHNTIYGTLQCVIVSSLYLQQRNYDAQNINNSVCRSDSVKSEPYNWYITLRDSRTYLSMIRIIVNNIMLHLIA
jgi:hypothetical protein